MKADKPSEHAADSFEHDLLCMKTALEAYSLVKVLRPDLIDPDPLETLQFEMVRLSFKFEVPLGRGFVDVMLFDRDKPVLCLEVKTKKDNQSPGGWLRQINFYAHESNAPGAIVVSHDLVPVQLHYLRMARMPVFDLRTMDLVK